MVIGRLTYLPGRVKKNYRLTDEFRGESARIEEKIPIKSGRFSAAVKEKFRVLGVVLDGNGLVGDVAGPLGNAITDGGDNDGKNDEKQNDADQCPSFHGLSFHSSNPGSLTVQAS